MEQEHQGFPLTSLLPTKLYRPPVTTDLEQRTHLIERLERRRRRPLTLISAPAGYGKSILASMWLESCSCASVWISLDEGDNDLHTFVSYVLAAVSGLFPTLRLKTRPLLDAPTIPSVSVLARYLINDLNQIPEPFILALDDLHWVKEPSVYELLDELLRHPLPNLHMVLIGRHDPPLKIASLRAHSQVTEIHAFDLRFNVQETTGLLSSLLDRPIDPVVAADWAERTEGWVTALRLVALSLRHHGHGDDLWVRLQGDNRYLRDYLIAEVLASLPEAHQAWLLKTALLDRFCAPLCEVVCQMDTNSASLTGTSFIEWLKEENLFLVPLDEKGEWFRLHHLFQGLLVNMLQSQLRVDEIRALYMRASAWNEEQNLIDRAIQYALRGGETETAVRLVDQHRYELMNTEQWSRLERWLKLLPGEVVAQNPLLLSTNAYIATYRGQPLEMMLSAQHAEQLLADITPGTSEYQLALSEIDAICAVLDNMAGRVTRSMERAQRSLKYLPQNALHMRAIALAANAVGLQMMGDPQAGATVIREALAKHTWPVGLQAQLMFLLCIALFQEGDLDGVFTSARAGLWIMDKDSLPGTLNFLRYFQGVVHYLRNEFTQAETVLRDLLEDRAAAAPTYLANGSFALALIYQAQNQPAQALQVIDLLKTHFQETKDSSSLIVVKAFQVEMALRQGELEEARRLTKSLEFGHRPPTWFFYVPQLTPIKLLLAEGTPDGLEDAHARLGILEEAMRTIHRKNVQLDVLALQALVYAAQADEPAALKKLSAALELGMVGRNLRSFADLGTPMARLLQRLLEMETGQEYAEYIRQILAAFPDEVHASQVREPVFTREGSQPAETPLNEPLTRREIQVLKLLATDLNMRDIAARLHITTGTLNSHTKNIYSKVGVHKRAQAVQRGRKAGLI